MQAREQLYLVARDFGNLEVGPAGLGPTTETEGALFATRVGNLEALGKGVTAASALMDSAAMSTFDL